MSISVSVCVPGGLKPKRVGSWDHYHPCSYSYIHNHLGPAYNESIDTAGVSWSTPTGMKSGKPGEWLFKTQLSHGAGVVSKADSRRFWALIRDTCVPSHLIKAGFPEKEAILQQNHKINSLKGTMTICTFSYFRKIAYRHLALHKRNLSKSSAVWQTCVRFFSPSFFTGHHSVLESAPWWEVSKTFPNLITGLQKPPTMPRRARQLRSQAKVRLCFIFPSFHLLLIRTIWMCRHKLYASTGNT